MNRRKTAVSYVLFAWVIARLAAHVLLIASPGTALAQNATEEPKGEDRRAPGLPPELSDPTTPDELPLPSGAGIMRHRTNPASMRLHQQRVDAAAKKLRAAKTDDEKLVAKAELHKVLADVFEQDMKVREAQAGEIEARLAKLREQYQARENAKDEIIDRHLQAIEQDAAGLGFPGADASSLTASPDRRPMIGSTFHPQAVVPDEQLQKYGASARKRIEELARVGHFTRSSDGKLYAYVENNVEGAERTAQIRVCDARSGQRLFAANVEMPVGKLRFYSQGVATLDDDGKPTIRVSFNSYFPADDVQETTVPDRAYPGTLRPARSLPFVDPQQGSIISEYNELRNQYRVAQMSLDAQKDPEARSAANLRRALAEAIHLIDSKLRLLELDLKAAEIALRAAESKWNDAKDRYEANIETKSEFDKYRAARDTAQLEVERAKTLYDLFKSIKTTPATDDSKTREH